MSEMIRVLIADDQELIRSGFKAILSTYPDIQVVGVAKDGVQAVEMASTLKPDVVLMDIRMPNKDGIAATRDIAGNPMLADTHVLVLTTFDVDEYVYDALEAGASGFLLKDADPDDIVGGIRVVSKGDALIEPSVMRRLIEDFVEAKDAKGPLASTPAGSSVLGSLTDREREILFMVARGMTNDEIADRLTISPATVKTHLARIMAKTSTHDRAQLVVLAYETGLVTPNS